VGVLKLTEE